MNDRYLFKAKRIDNGEWVTGSYVYTFAPDKECPVIGLMKENHFIVEQNGHICIIDPSTLCPCTGLKDKNGMLIWENDVVRYCDCTEERYVIAWEENKACFEYQQYGCSIMNFDELSGIEVEVIGSYIDNPELLEV